MAALSVSLAVEPRNLELYIEYPANPANENRCTMLKLIYPNAQDVTYQEVKNRVRRDMHIPHGTDFDLDYEHGNQQIPAIFHRLYKREPYVRLRVCPPARFLSDHNLGMQNTQWKTLSSPDANRAILDFMNSQLPRTPRVDDNRTWVSDDEFATAQRPPPLDPKTAANELYRRAIRVYRVRFSYFFVLLVMIGIYLIAYFYIEAAHLFPQLEIIVYTTTIYLSGCVLFWMVSLNYE